MATTDRRLPWHKLLLPLIDAVLVNVALLLALWLRFEGDIPAVWWDAYREVALLLTPWVLLAAWIFGLYHRVWEFARGEAVVAITLAVSIGMAVGWIVLGLAAPGHISRSILAMTWLFALLFIGGSRFTWRQIRRYLRSSHESGNDERRRVLVYGAGHSGSSVVRHADLSPSLPYDIVGFIDDDPALRGMIVAGHRVLGAGVDLPRLVERHNIHTVIIAAPSASGDEVRRMLGHVRASGAEVTRLPRLLETVAGRVTIADARRVELQDLLGRDLADVDLSLDPDYIGGRRVLVTGAGGSIGSEICRQLCRYRPAELVLLGRGENRIHAVYKTLAADYPEIPLHPVICNFTNEDDVARVFGQHRPQVVFHAGAHKHVYLMQSHPTEAVRNNVIGTAVVARQASAAGVERFVAISTDKAVEPCNVMGASKRLCELLLMKLDRESATRFTVVRFGNVMGSSGSVLTIFTQQAAAGRPLTVTHREATRFFMTVEEAAFLVLQAGALGEGGDIFVLEMGEPVCIYEMAREFLVLNGRDPDEPGAIQITQLTAGEKLHEKLHSADETLEPTRSPHILRVARNGAAEPTWSVDELLARARRAVTDPSRAEALLYEVCGAPIVPEQPAGLQMTGE